MADRLSRAARRREQRPYATETVTRFTWNAYGLGKVLKNTRCLAWKILFVPLLSEDKNLKLPVTVSNLHV